MYTIPFLFLFGLSYIVVFPTSIYTAYQLYKTWNKQYITKRRRFIILALFILTVNQSLCLTVIFNPSTQYFHISVIGFGSICILSVLRIYLLYYDHKYNHAISSNKWRIMIDPSVEFTNWFLLNKKTYGNHKYIAQRIILPFFVSFNLIYLSSIYLIAPLIATHFTMKIKMVRACIDFAAMCILATITAVIVVICWKRFPKVTDTLLIRNEITYDIYIGIGGVIVMIIMGILLIWSYIATNANNEYWLYAYSAVQLLWCVFLFVLTVYPQRCNKRSLLIRKSSSPMTASYTAWGHIVETKAGYEQFAQFLANEFSIENLLFITEYVHLKMEMMNISVLNELINNELKLNYHLNLPETIPLSMIAQDFQGIFGELELETTQTSDNNNETCAFDVNKCAYDSLEKIFTKYVDSAKAVLEINISYQVRIDLTNAFKHRLYDCDLLNDVLRLMEEAVTEIAILINDSNSRFRQKTVYFALADASPLP